MTGSYSFTFSTALRASTERVWAHAGTFAGVNSELWPLACMTYPRTQGRLTEDFPLGRTAFRSWVLLFGFIPVDFDDFTLIQLEVGRGFHEESRLLSMRAWRHRRTLIPAGQGCVVRDELTFVPRWRLAGPILAGVYRLAFALRHRALRRIFGAPR